MKSYVIITAIVGFVFASSTAMAQVTNETFETRVPSESAT